MTTIPKTPSPGDRRLRRDTIPQHPNDPVTLHLVDQRTFGQVLRISQAFPGAPCPDRIHLSRTGALALAPAILETLGWQHMPAAPRDGRAVRLKTTEGIFVARYFGRHELTAYMQSDWICQECDGECEGEFAPSGWYIALPHTDLDYGYKYVANPLGWFPLPSPETPHTTHSTAGRIREIDFHKILSGDAKQALEYAVEAYSDDDTPPEGERPREPQPATSADTAEGRAGSPSPPRHSPDTATESEAEVCHNE